MARELWSGRIHPALTNEIRKSARDLRRSEAYIVEMALVEMFKDRLPGGFQPGEKMDDGDDRQAR